MRAIAFMRAALAVGLLIALSACVSLQRPQYQPVSAEVVPVRGFFIGDPKAIIDPRGLRFHGWICRNYVGGFAPRELRIEQLDEKGSAAATATAIVNVPSRSGCSFYDIPTDWRLPVGARVRLCRKAGSFCPGDSPIAENRGEN